MTGLWRVFQWVMDRVLRTHNPQGDFMNKYTRIEKIRFFAEKIAKAIPEGQNKQLDDALGAIEYLTSERYQEWDTRVKKSELDKSSEELAKHNE